MFDGRMIKEAIKKNGLEGGGNEGIGAAVLITYKLRHGRHSRYYYGC